MLKKDLEKKLKEANEEIATMKRNAEKVCEDALQNCCDDALPYVSKLSSALGLDITIKSTISVDVNLPVQLLCKYREKEIDAEDIALNIFGNNLEATYINTFDEE